MRVLVEGGAVIEEKDNVRRECELLVGVSTCVSVFRQAFDLYTCICLIRRRFHCRILPSQDGYTALMRTASRGHAVCVRVLLEAGAAKDATSNVRDNLCHLCAYANTR